MWYLIRAWGTAASFLLQGKDAEDAEDAEPRAGQRRLAREPAQAGWLRCPCWPPPATSCGVLLTAQKEYRLAQGPAWDEAGRVVPKKDGTQKAPSSLKSQWWNWVARQRIDPHLPIHGLRDSFGTWVYEEYGVKQAQEWLGHSDPATTLRHYFASPPPRGRRRWPGSTR